ncbi:MAG: hypothetical protein ABIR55_22205 [Burkholderiaceae bacterium]
MTSARGYPRFLPTLTEVVHVAARQVEPPEDLVAAEAARREAFAQRMRVQLRLALDERMHDAVADAMLEQVDVIGERLRRQMDDMVRESLDTITDRLRAELDTMVHAAVQSVLFDDASNVNADAPQGPVEGLS